MMRCGVLSVCIVYQCRSDPPRPRLVSSVHTGPARGASGQGLGHGGAGRRGTHRLPLAELDALLEAADNRQARKVTTLLRALTYVAGQADLIIDYAAGRHRGEPISTATTASTVQRLRHRRMGAHRILKVRTAVMNGSFASEHSATEPYARRPFRTAA